MAATYQASRYVGQFGMGKSLISAPPAINPLTGDANPVQNVLSDPDRKKEVDELLQSCRTQVRALLVQKRHVVEGIRDALLDREELIGDEIEELMAELGEREPLPVPAGALLELPPTGNGHPPGDGNGQVPDGSGQPPA
jgi:ATP-dependent Zn protease